MNNGNNGHFREGPIVALSLTGYDSETESTLKLLADGLIGRPDWHALVARLGYKSEEELCQKRDCHSLHDLFFSGNFFSNFSAIRKELNSGRYGY